MFKMKFKKTKFYLLQIFILAIVLTICKFASNETFAKSKSAPKTTTKTTSVSKKHREAPMRGVWISYINLNMGSHPNPERAFKLKFDNMVRIAKKNKMNALFVAVRPFSDALYPSKTFPWSHCLTGEQGKNPGFDPLKYMVKKAHASGLEFHAWLNPFRISLNNVPSKLSASNPYNKLKPKKYFIKYDGGICYNPAYSEVQNLIVDGVKEIVKKYDVDGIHFDDYFYPTSADATAKDTAYKNYCKKGGKMGIHQWRMKNVNTFVKKVYKSVKEIKPNVEFGISPSGNTGNCYSMGADVKTWCEKNGYIDYICPQIYWSLDFKTKPFEKTAKEWRNLVKNKNVNLYCGLALYKIGTDADNGTWKGKNNILAREFKISKKLNYNGVILYSYGQICSEKTTKEMQNLKKEF